MAMHIKWAKIAAEAPLKTRSTSFQKVKVLSGPYGSVLKGGDATGNGSEKTSSFRWNDDSLKSSSDLEPEDEAALWW